MTQAELRPGYSISRIIKGGWQLAGGHGRIDPAAALEDMRAFVEAGVTTFDCADIYTGVEARIGDFRRRYPELARRVQVHTKFVPDLAVLGSMTAADVEQAVDRSLHRLGQETLDLVQFHWWDYAVPRYVEVAHVLDRLRGKGKIRHLGATNFDTPRLRELLDAGIRLVSHQVQYSVVDRRPERGMAALCAERGVNLLCYGAVLGGLLSERWLGAPEPSEPFENRSLTKYLLVIEELGGWAAYQGLLAALRDVAARRGTSLAAIGLAWVLGRPAVAGVIVGARHAGHLQETLAAEALRLDESELQLLEAARRGARGPEGDVYDLERVPGGRHAAIMRYDLNAQAED